MINSKYICQIPGPKGIKLKIINLVMGSNIPLLELDVACKNNLIKKPRGANRTANHAVGSTFNLFKNNRSAS